MSRPQSAPRLGFPLQMQQGGDIRWAAASYTAIHHVLTNPVYAGAYAYGKTRYLPRSQWQVLIPQHHPGFIDWQTYEANQARIAKNNDPDRTIQVVL